MPCEQAWFGVSNDGARFPTNEKIARDYERPFGWWGLESDTSSPLTLARIIANGSIGVGEAALLSLAIEMRRSIIVTAEEERAGKTTLLTALLQFLDPSTRPVYIRGIYERFEYLEALDPENRYVLCNEISAHLPTYLWGQGVRYLFLGLDAGFPLATTMHAATAADVLAALQRYPLDVPPEHVAQIDLVVVLRRGMVDGQEVRRVMRIEQVRDRDGNPTLRPLALRETLRSAPQLYSGRMISALSGWGHIDDEAAARLLAKQERFLTDSVARYADDASGFLDALERFRGR